MGLILKPLVNYWSVYQTDIRGLRECYCFYYSLLLTLFINILYIIVIAILLAEPLSKNRNKLGIKMDIATLIKEYRIKTGMTQQELADKVFVTRQTISKWELGKSEPDNVSLELLFKEMNIEKNPQKTLKLI